eukprot:15448268-Alexandrium_andersonii.AAC.1
MEHTHPRVVERHQLGVVGVLGQPGAVEVHEEVGAAAVLLGLEPLPNAPQRAAPSHDPVQGLQTSFLTAHGLPEVHRRLGLEDRGSNGGVQEHERLALVQGV